MDLDAWLTSVTGMDRRWQFHFPLFVANKRLQLVVGLLLIGGLVFGQSSGRSASSFQSEQINASPLFVPELLKVTGPRQISMEVTAYCPCPKCCGPNARGLTASGRTVEYNSGRFIAADTTVLPFGTKVSIPGYHDGLPVEVVDRGSAIKGNKLDVFFPTHQAAKEWGRRKVTVSVYDGSALGLPIASSAQASLAG